nr:SDR family NAD(P)-dependent oxidoreductase [Pseudomonadota bacterium]
MDGVMIVTGASRGIGAAIAQLAGRRGYKVCVNYHHRADRAEQIVASIRAEGGKAIA